MSDAHNTRNYFAHGSRELVIGGKLTFLPGASVEGVDGLFDAPAGEVRQIPYIPNSTAPTLASFKEDYNRLLQALREARIMAAEPIEVPGDAK